MLIPETVSLMYTKNRRGPRIEPWGRPAEILDHEEAQLDKQLFVYNQTSNS